MPSTQKIFNKTKIVATIGPATSKPEMLKRLMKAGMEIARLNFSHGSHKEYAEVIKHIRLLNKELGLHVGILADLQGPKIRVGVLPEGGVRLKEGQVLELVCKEGTTYSGSGETSVLPVQYKSLAKDIKKGERILLDDGKLELVALGTDRKFTVRAKVQFGGLLTSNKGMNLPDTDVSISSITPKDLKDIAFAQEHAVDWIALSFVRKATEIEKLRGILEQGQGRKPFVMAKIETPAAVQNIESILKVTDAIMVARGDLGVEIPMEKVPVIQKRLVALAREYSRPAIIATQMMESMIQNPTPTRAEANDVANGVLDGADALMLSGETSVGKHPVEVITAMRRIIANVEAESYHYGQMNPPQEKSPTYLADSICYSACVLGEQVGAKAIVGMTFSGFTGFKISAHRPRANVFVFTGNRSLLCALSLVWGVHGYYYDRYESTDQTISDVNKTLLENKHVRKGDLVVNTASIPLLERGRTNMVKVTRVE